MGQGYRGSPPSHWGTVLPVGALPAGAGPTGSGTSPDPQQPGRKAGPGAFAKRATGNTAVWHCDCVGGVQDGDGPLPFPAVPAAGSRWFLGRQALEDLGSGAPALLGRLRQISVGEFLPGLGQEILAGLSMLLDRRRVGAAG